MLGVALDKLVPEYVKNFEAYIPSKPDPELMRLYACNRIYRLNNNENPLGPPAAARAILEKFNPYLAAVYPSGDSYYLRHKLAAKFNMEPDQFLVGNGANEVIAFVIKAFCQEGDNIITADKTFAVYEWVAEFSGFKARLVPLKDFAFDAQGMLDRIDERTKILFVCNPNNPTGTYWDEDTLRKVLDTVAGRQIVVADEAYSEFVENSDFPNGMELLKEYPNLVVFRTFSKMYGLAGLRIGYLAGDLKTVEHVRNTRKLVREQKAYLTSELSRLRLQIQAGEGCYIMIKLPISDTLAYRKLMAHGVMVRSMTGFRYPNWIRVSIGKPDAMEAFIKALENMLHGQ
jgi:histidinol-phosphate aminotransferase